jgi:hypothetical protein
MSGKRASRALPNVAALVTLTAFIVTAWVVIGFNRVGLAGSNEPAAVPLLGSRTDLQPTPVSAQANRSTVLSKRETLVYVLGGDATYYHSPMHAMHDQQRQVLALPAAKARGLAPCPACFPAKGGAGLQATANR